MVTFRHTTMSKYLLKPLSTFLFFITAISRVWAQIDIVAGASSSSTAYGLAGAAYQQSFDSLPSTSGASFTWTSNATLPGWFAVDSTGATNSAATTLTGSGNPNNLVIASVGTSGATDRALTYHTRLASNPTHLGLAFVNQSGAPLNSFSLAFAAEQWREATNARTISLSVAYRVGATAADLPAASGWTTIPGLVFSTLNGSGTASASLNSAAIPVTVPAGSTLWLRWSFANDATTDTNSHDILAIDNVSFSATATPSDRAPTFVTSPASQSVLVGATVSFSAAVDASPAATLQWFHGVNPIPSATSATYSINSATLADAADYTVVATNSLGSATSAVATLSVQAAAAPPAITTQPADLTVQAGASATFTVAATGTAPLSYQWFHDGTPISGATNASATTATLTLAAVTSADAGNYTVTVTNTANSVTSSAAALTVTVPVLPPAITTPPASQTVTPGQTVTFSVAVSGTAPFSYQWQRDSVDRPGRTSPTLSLTSVTGGDAGAYRVVVTNAQGTATSAAATLAVVVVQDTAAIYVSPTGADSSPGTFAAPTSLTRAITLVPAGGIIYLRGGTYVFSDQITIARTNVGGGPSTRKHLFAYTPPGGSPELPRIDFSSQPYGTGTNPRGLQIDGHYWHVRGLEVFGSADNGIYVAGNSNIIERCITHHNRDTGLQIGRYSSTAADPAEWPSDNLILNCESYDNYDLPPGGGENADGFACKLTSGTGNVFRGCVSHNNIDDGWDLFTKTATGPIGPVVIDQCIAYNNGTLTDGTQNPAGDRNGFKLGGEDIAVAHTVTRSIAFGNGKNGFTWNSNPGAIRMFHNLAWDNAQGNYKFDLPGPVFLDNISLWTTGSGTNDRYGGNSGIATGPSNVFWFASGTPKSRNDQGIQVSASSFVTLTPPPGGFARRVDGSLDLGNFARPVSGSPLVNAGTKPDASYQPDLTYDIATYYEGAADIGPREVYLATAPVFALSPVGDSVMPGATVVLTSYATGTEPITYQWFRGTTAVSGATGTTLVLANVDATVAGDYTLRATNSIGTTTSSPATLIVQARTPPVITSSPASLTVPLGAAVNLSVTATGTAPLTYQWFHDDQPVAGALYANLVIPSASLADAGGYHVVVTNASGSATSPAFNLNVDTTPLPPVITTPPVSTSVLAGGTASLSVTATGTPPLTYEWRRRGAALPGANGPSLSFSPARMVDASDYSVVVSNATGSVTGGPVSLSVLTAAPSTIVNDTFADASRGTQAPPASVAWWTSAGASNFNSASGSTTLIASSSRTVLAHFTSDPAAPLTLALGQTLTFTATLQWTGFDDAAASDTSNFHVALLRSVANPDAVTGTGFTATGTPNTAARVSGDFGSSQPTSNVFSLYQGYVAFAQARSATTESPVPFAVRNLSSPSLLGSSAAYTPLAADAPTASTALAPNTSYRVTLSVSRTAAGLELAYTLRRVSDDTVVAIGSALDTASTFNAFDTFAFYFGKAATTATYNITFYGASVTLASLPALDFTSWRAGWALSGADANDNADPDRDGLPNLLEYALGLSPSLVDATPDTLPQLTGHSGALSFRYTRSKTATGVSYGVETSSDLQSWSAAASAPTLESETTSTETYTVPIPAGTRVFGRLRVTAQ